MGREGRRQIGKMEEQTSFKVNIRGLMTSLYTEHEILKKGVLKLGLLFENLNADAQTDSIFETEGDRIPGSDMVTMGGINTRLYLDFRDRKIFAGICWRS